MTGGLQIADWKNFRKKKTVASEVHVRRKSNPEKNKPTSAEKNVHSQEQKDRSNKRDASYLVLDAFDRCSRCEQYTHKYSTCRVAQHNHIPSREHAWLKIKDCTSLCPKNNCHPRVMSHSLPHLTLTTSTSSLSPISSTLIFPTVSPSQTSPMILNPYIPCDGPRQSGGSIQIPSLTGYEPKSVEFKDIDTEAIDL